MLKNILPANINQAIEHLNYAKLCEIRLRVGKPIIVDYGGQYFLCESGITDNIGQAYICEKSMLENLLVRACENSLYAYNEELKQGYITISGGMRIGLCGQCVKDGEAIKTIKNISSVNIRIPHDVKNCSLKLLEFIAQPRVFNTLIISPPGAGKTTILRDFANQLSRLYAKNILIIDERNEIANCVNGIPQHEIGVFCDVITNCSKQFGLQNGIRSIRPDVVFTDEVANLEDIEAIHYALGCGVRLVATAHCGSIEELSRKKNFETIIKEGMFERYVVLSAEDGPGTIDGVYDAKFKCLYF